MMIWLRDSKLPFLFVINSFLIALFPITTLYAFYRSITLGHFLVLISIMLYLIFTKKPNINITFLLFLLYFAFHNILLGLIKYEDLNNTLNNSLGVILIAIIGSFVLNGHFINKESFIRSAGIILAINLSLLIVQISYYLLKGEVIFGQIPIFEPTQEAYLMFSSRLNRFAGSFTEPAHLAIYIAPFYIYSLFQRRSFFLIAICTMGLLLSTSLTGLFICIFYLFIFIFKRKEKHKKTLNFILISILVITCILFVHNKYYSRYEEKIKLESFLNNERILGTKEIVNVLTLEEKLFGVGLNRLAEISYNKGTPIKNYSNSLLFVFYSYGLLGTAVFIIFMICLYKKIKKGNFLYFLLFLIILLSDQILFNRNFLYLLLWLTYFSNEGNSSHNKTIAIFGRGNWNNIRFS